MLATFPNISFGILVGIGAGIPNDTKDVRLGNVVIGMPSGTLGGVFQYDLGKSRAEKWERIGLLPRPLDVLLKAISKMQSQHEMSDSMIPEILGRALQRNSKMAKTYAHPGTGLDLLFVPSYEHIGFTNDCSDCDLEKQISRPARDSANPEIHYGIIASGNALVKDANMRDRIANMEPGCICLEMEAAGLIGHFPCLVIRGISGKCTDFSQSLTDRVYRLCRLTQE